MVMMREHSFLESVTEAYRVSVLEQVLSIDVTGKLRGASVQS